MALGTRLKNALSTGIEPHQEGSDRARRRSCHETRLRDALDRPNLPCEVLDDAFRKVIRGLKAPDWKPAIARSVLCWWTV